MAWCGRRGLPASQRGAVLRYRSLQRLLGKGLNARQARCARSVADGGWQSLRLPAPVRTTTCRSPRT
jgi:hypothetical protein